MINNSTNGSGRRSEPSERGNKGPAPAKHGSGAAPTERASATAQGVEPGVLPHLVDFFDTDHDGKISIPESINGLRRLGIGRLASTTLGLGINLGLAAITPDNPFALNVARMYKAKHPSDTDVIDERGGFAAHRFEEVFRKYGGPNSDALSGRALARLWFDNVLRDLRPLSVVGATAGVGELGLLYYVGGQKTERGTVLTKQRMSDFYTRPELFEEIAREQESARAERNKTLPGKLANAFHAWIF